MYVNKTLLYVTELYTNKNCKQDIWILTKSVYKQINLQYNFTYSFRLFDLVMKLDFDKKERNSDSTGFFSSYI